MNPDQRQETFATPAPIKLRVELPKGRIRVIAAETAETRITLTAIRGDETALDWIADAEIRQSGEEVVVKVHGEPFRFFGHGGSIEAEVHVPAGSDARLQTGSGRIETEGRLADVHAGSGSGAIRLADCAEARVSAGSGDISVASATGSVDLKTGSGQIAVGKVGGDARIVTGSGRTELGEVAGVATITTGSGSIDVEKAGDSLEAFAASGNIGVRRADHGRVKAKTISGRISVGVARGVPALLDISTMTGRVHSDLEPAGAPADGQPHVELVLNTMSGSVSVARA